MAPSVGEWSPTDAQSELINADGSQLVEACPGAGKTRTIVARYQRVAGEGGRRGVALLSFTNAAVDEVRRRCDDPKLLEGPNFVGTFDSFINRFVTGPVMATKLRKAPRFVESWQSVPAASFSTAGVPRGVTFSLDQFVWNEDGVYKFDPSLAGGQFAAALRKAYLAEPDEIDRTAAALRKWLVNDHLVVPCVESRRIARKALAGGTPVGARVALRRFRELIVDEAQDCGLEELDVLRAAVGEGVDVVAVADPDQAIFEFRQAMPEELSRFGDEIGRGTRLSGNFRSSPAIVRVSERLRASDHADDAVGPQCDNLHDIVVFDFDSHDQVADIVRTHLAIAGIEPSDVVVLAHRADDAARCAGSVIGTSSSKRAVLVFADAALTIRTTDDPARRRRALAAAERALLRAAGASTNLTLDDDANALGLSPRWVRDAATRVIFGADPREVSRSDYTDAVRQIVRGVGWPEGTTLTNKALATPPEEAWSGLGVTQQVGQPGLPWMTVHASKGREFEAVCLVIPRKLRSDGTGLTCLDHWEQGSDAESRRVLYVGATRAVRLLLVGAHRDHVDRVSALLG